MKQMTTLLMCSAFLMIGLGMAMAFGEPGDAKRAERIDALFGRDNLVAWCIVPFDGKKRGPAERAEMLNRLDLSMLAYDWREEHVPTFDEEIKQLDEHDIALKSFWVYPGVLNERTELILDVLKRHDIKTELWTLINEPAGETDEQKVQAAASQLRPLAEAADAVGCRIGLYNHTGWFGEPDNQIAIIKELGMDNIGIVYNFHHGHEHVDDMADILENIKPYLYCLNINGMDRDGPKRGRKILPLGQGELDLELLNTIVDSGYDGPIGIIGHTQDDVEQRLLDNLDGLDWLIQRMKGESAGNKPRPRTGT